MPEQNGVEKQIAEVASRNLPQDPQYAALIENQRLILGVVREMKEIPELPSEAPKDVSSILKVELPEEGGVLTYMTDHAYAYRGFPFFEFVDKIDIIKKISRAFLSSLFHSFKTTNKLWLVTLLPALWAIKPLVHAGIYVFYRMVERFRIKPKMYSRSIRELHRALSVERDGEGFHERTLRIQVRDLLCMILENDNAYRFRFQDLVPDINQEALLKDPVTELVRIFTIMQSCERTQDIKDTWTLFSLFVKWYLRIDRKLCRIIALGLSRIDKNLARLSVEDRYYCVGRQDYTFRWIERARNPVTSEDRENERIIKEYRIYEEKRLGLGELRQQYIKEIDALNTRHAEEVKIPFEGIAEKHLQERMELEHRFEPKRAEIEERFRERLTELKQFN